MLFKIKLVTSRDDANVQKFYFAADKFWLYLLNTTNDKEGTSFVTGTFDIYKLIELLSAVRNLVMHTKRALFSEAKSNRYITAKSISANRQTGHSNPCNVWLFADALICIKDKAVTKYILSVRNQNQAASAFMVILPILVFMDVACHGNNHCSLLLGLLHLIRENVAQNRGFMK